MDQEREDQLTNDLHRHAAEEIEAVLNRHMKVAQKALMPASVAIVLMRLASGFGLGAALYSLQLRSDGTTPEEIWSLTMKSIANLTELAKPQVLNHTAASSSEVA